MEENKLDLLLLGVFGEISITIYQKLYKISRISIEIKQLVVEARKM